MSTGEHMILTAVLSGAGAIALLLIWRHMSVARGARKRDEALSSRLAPLAARFEAKRPVAQEEVAHLAGSPELRQMLYAMCSHYQRLHLFPAEFLRKERQAESVLAYWLQHPNELQAAPEALEYVETMQHPYGSAVAEFFVFRYRMPAGHWAGTDWLLGLAGPFFPDEKPYESVAGGFSRAGDVFGKADAQELVQRYARRHQRR
jgi:hypothetical protein